MNMSWCAVALTLPRVGFFNLFCLYDFAIKGWLR
jgi:hypothetical protein